MPVKKTERKTGLMFATLMILVFSVATKYGFGSPYQGLMGAGSAGVKAGQSPCELFDGLVRVVNNTRLQVEAIVEGLPEDLDDLESIRGPDLNLFARRLFLGFRSAAHGQ